MAYIGKQPEFTQYPSKFFDGDGSAMTVTLDYAPPNDAALLVFIDGVRQDTSAYNCTGTSCVFTGSVPSGTNNVQVVHMGLTVDVAVPADDTITTVKIQDDAVTAAKLANSINTEIAANTAKVTNATHTGDVTGATALTIATDAVDIAMLSATGTASATTFLRGDNSWQTAGVSTLAALTDATISSVIPTISTNPSSGVGHLWLNSTTGQSYICTNATTGNNIWTNIGDGSGGVSPSAILTVTFEGGTPTTHTVSDADVVFSAEGYYTVTTNNTAIIAIELWGGGGAGAGGAQNKAGPAGGYVTGRRSMVTGTTYVFLVGQGGSGDVSGSGTYGTSFPDGGSGGGVERAGGAGSSRFAPYIQTGGEDLDNNLSDLNNTGNVYDLIAGGAGGKPANLTNGTVESGWGGGTVGDTSLAYYSADGSSAPGAGGTQSAGGAGGTGGRGANGTAGAKYLGGNSADGTGGGGGYFGGGGSAGNYAGGGGGSGFINAGTTTNASFDTAATATWNVSPAGTGKPDTYTGDGSSALTSRGYDGGIRFTYISS